MARLEQNYESVRWWVLGMGATPMGLGITLIVFSLIDHLLLFLFSKHEFSLSLERLRGSEKAT